MLFGTVRRIKLSTPPKKLSTGSPSTYPQAVSNFVTKCYDISLDFPRFLGFHVRGRLYTDYINKEKDNNMAEKDNYYLVQYIENGREVYSAVHWRDLAKFRAEFEIISITG